MPAPRSGADPPGDGIEGAALGQVWEDVGPVIVKPGVGEIVIDHPKLVVVVVHGKEAAGAADDEPAGADIGCVVWTKPAYRFF